MAVTDSLVQRTNMVESQIRPSDVTDRRILRAMQAVERDKFVPTEMASLAYMDIDVPLSAQVRGRANTGRTLMSPRSFAKLVQLAAIEPDHKILVVGAGRGYSACVLALLAAEVVALECDAGLAEIATQSLKPQANVTVVVGPLCGGLAGHGPYDAILVDGLIGVEPVALIGQLKPGGRLVAIQWDGHVGQATRWLKVGDHVAKSTAFESAAGLLPGFEAHERFSL
jgi:protein-L-isoaspartate(D-aspartate) O-methyltransferase